MYFNAAHYHALKYIIFYTTHHGACLTRGIGCQFFPSNAVAF